MYYVLRPVYFVTARSIRHDILLCPQEKDHLPDQLYG